MKMYLEDYIRMSSEDPAAGVSASRPGGASGLFESDPALKEIWGMYAETPGSPVMKRIARRTSETTPRKIEI